MSLSKFSLNPSEKDLASEHVTLSVLRESQAEESNVSNRRRWKQRKSAKAMVVAKSAR